jgi:hypothetical protein
MWPFGQFMVFLASDDYSLFWQKLKRIGVTCYPTYHGVYGSGFNR